MEWKSLIEVEIQKGFSKSTIERLAGLSKNILASALSGKRDLSKIGRIKIERWLASEKPDPLTLIKPTGKPVKSDTTSKQIYFERNKSEVKPLMRERIDEFKKQLEGSFNNTDILKQIEEIKAEKIPKERDTSIGRRVWNGDQYKRIKELESKLI